MTFLYAAEASASEIRGSVYNEGTKKNLDLAVVVINETKQQALTDTNGTFRLAGLPAGTYTLVASYADLDDVTKTVTVKDGETATVEFPMTSSVYVLGAVTVTSAREGTAFAVQQQRRAETARTVTSVDAFISQSSGNPGEFLKNVEGIQMEYSQNEPQKIRIRGIDPNLTSVTMDGNEIASAGSSSTDRAVQVDQLSIATIDNVEVFKANVPWMSANAIGGAVNFNTKSAFDLKAMRAFVQVGVNTDSADFLYKRSNGPGQGEKAELRTYPTIRFEISNSFLDNRLGFVFSVGYDKTNQLGSSTLQDINATVIPGVTAPAYSNIPYNQGNVLVRRARYSISPNRQQRTRGDISLNLDYKLSDTLSMSLKNTYQDYLSTNRNHGFTMTPATLTDDSTLENYTTLNGAISQSCSIFDKKTKTWQVSPSLKYQSGDWKAELAGGFSKSTNHYGNPTGFGALNLVVSGIVNWSMATPTHTDEPEWVGINLGLNPYELNNYVTNQAQLHTARNGSRITFPNGTQITPSIPIGVQRAGDRAMVENNKRDSASTKYSARLDLRRDFPMSIPFNIRTGLSRNEQYFIKHQDRQQWYWLGDDGVANAADYTVASKMGRFAEPVPVTSQIKGYKLVEPTYFSQNVFYNYWKENPQVLQENKAYHYQQAMLGRMKVSEKITAAYLAGQMFIKDLEVLIGMRFERTDLIAEGVRTQSDLNLLAMGFRTNQQDTLEWNMEKYSPQVTDSSYNSKPFKYLHLKYEILRNLQVRAAYTDAIGRPNLTDVLPNTTEATEGAVTEYNSNRAGLRPQVSKNYDLSVEYYTKSSGQWTFGWYKRDITDYINTQRFLMTPELAAELGIPYREGSRVNSRGNLGSARWEGIEAKFAQGLSDFSFMPTFLHGISFWGNYTKNYKLQSVDASGVKIKTTANVVPESYNAGIRYRTPAGKFTAHFSVNYQSEKSTINIPADWQGAEPPVGAQLTPYTAWVRAPRQDDYQFFNLELNYKFTKQLSLSCVGRNIFNERPRFTEVMIQRNTQQATGIVWVIAAKYDL